MSKQLIAIGKDDQLITTCGAGCGSTVTLYQHAAALVEKTGIRPMCTECKVRAGLVYVEPLPFDDAINGWREDV